MAAKGGWRRNSAHAWVFGPDVGLYCQPFHSRFHPVFASILTVLVACASEDGAQGLRADDAGQDLGGPLDLGQELDVGAPLDLGDGDMAQDEEGGCGSVMAQGLSVEALPPSVTDPEIRSGDPDHRHLAAAGSATGRLFLFLPGATAQPSDYVDVLRNAAAGGDDALGLSYVNDARIFVVCGSDPDPDCQESFRIEVLFGESRSPHVDVGPADSISNRLVKVLQHLGWTNYLDGDEPRWSSIAVAGHSQGSGHAAMIGRFFETERVIMVAGAEPAPWTLEPRMTPPARSWGFGHVDDQLSRAFRRAWDNLGIPGPPSIVDSARPPFGGTHQLLTRASPNPTDPNPHNSPIADTSTPRDAEGRSAYAEVWCHLLGL